jgi:hypothetical protein
LPWRPAIGCIGLAVGGALALISLSHSIQDSAREGMDEMGDDLVPAVYGIEAMRHVAVAVVNVHKYVRFLFMPSSDPLTNRKNLQTAVCCGRSRTSS